MATAQPLSWNDIRKWAIAFAAEWKGATRENAEAQIFWNDCFAAFTFVRRRYVQFERKATRISTGGRGWIDARAAHPGDCLADLYDRASMPLNLTRAHDGFERMYGFRKIPTTAERTARLFQRYEELLDAVHADPGQTVAVVGEPIAGTSH